jgi:hypothetical protein
MKLESFSVRDRFSILLEKRPSSVARLKYTMLYGKSQINEDRIDACQVQKNSLEINLEPCEIATFEIMV